jgi:hypothetical protein
LELQLPDSERLLGFRNCVFIWNYYKEKHDFEEGRTTKNEIIEVLGSPDFLVEKVENDILSYGMLLFTFEKDIFIKQGI